MYLEAIQKLSMYIVRKQKSESEGGKTDMSNLTDQHPVRDSQTCLDHETVINIKSLMDEHVFELLDKTEYRVLQL